MLHASCVPDYKSLQSELLGVWNDFDTGVISTRKFLRRCSHFVPVPTA